MNSQPTFQFLTYLNLMNYDHLTKNIILNRSALRSLALHIIEAFVQILLIVDLSLHQILLTFLLYMRQTWMAQLILAISL